MTDRDRITRTERGPLGRWGSYPPRQCIIEFLGPTQCGITGAITRCTKGEDKPVVGQRMPGAGLS